MKDETRQLELDMGGNGEGNNCRESKEFLEKARMKWDSVNLVDVSLTITKGTTPTTLGMQFSETGIPFVRVNNFKQGALFLNQDILFISKQTHQTLSRSIIKSGDVLLSIAGTIGRSCVVPHGSPEANCNQAVCIIRPNHSRLHSQYLHGWLSK